MSSLPFAEQADIPRRHTVLLLHTPFPKPASTAVHTHTHTYRFARQCELGVTNRKNTHIHTHTHTSHRECCILERSERRLTGAGYTDNPIQESSRGRCY